MGRGLYIQVCGYECYLKEVEEEARKLRNKEYIEGFLRAAAKECNTQLLEIYSYQFKDGGKGMTSFAVIGESHIHISTWPEKHSFSVGIETCGKKADITKLEGVIREFFEVERIRQLYRRV